MPKDNTFSNAAEVPVKMVLDEVGADIESKGFVPVTHENATLSPFSAKGSLSTALDEADDQGEDNKENIKGIENLKVDTNPLILEPSLEGGYDHDAQHDQRNEVEGDIEGTNMPKPKSGEVKETLAAALDALVLDGADAANQTEHEEQVQEENLKKVEEEKQRAEVPKIPASMGGGDEPDENGLVYITRIIEVDPTKYISNNYRPEPPKIKNAAKAGKKGRLAISGNTTQSPKESDTEIVVQEDDLEALGTPEAKASAASLDEPTYKEEAEAAKNANKAARQDFSDDKKQDISRRGKHENDVESLDEAVVMDCASVYDDTSRLCFDEAYNVDFSKVAMDIGPRNAPTRQTCQTTFAQCRAENPLYCRFHGPKLLEADIKTEITARLARQHINTAGLVVSVEKDSNRVTNGGRSLRFKVTVGCHRNQELQVEAQLDAMFKYNRPGFRMPGIKEVSNPRAMGSNENRTVSVDLEMDLLKADTPPRGGLYGGAERRIAMANRAIRETNNDTPTQETTPSPTNEPPSQSTQEGEVGNNATRSNEVGSSPSNEGRTQQPTQGARPTEEEQSIEREEQREVPMGGDGPTEAAGQTPPRNNNRTRSTRQEQSTNNTPTPNNNEAIEHLPGGVKARFSQSEKNSIEREMGNAIHISNANPDDMEAQSYAHALSHFLGSRDSTHGRRNNALAGIRDNITKAELLEKAENRLARDINNPAKYNGTVRALQKIAEISGLEGLVIDGVHVSLRDTRQQQAVSPANEESNSGDNNNSNTNREQSGGNEPHIEPFDFNAWQAAQGNNNDNTGSHAENVNAAPSNEPPRHGANADSPPTAEEVTEAANQLASATGYPMNAIRATLFLYLNGTRDIVASHLPILNNLPEGNPVRDALNRRWNEQSARRAEAEREAEEMRRQEEAAQARELADKATKAMIKPSTSNYIPNATVSKEEVERIRAENEEFWRQHRSLELLGNIYAQTKIARLLANCVQDASIREADDECVRSILPTVEKVDASNMGMGMHANEMNPFTSNPSPHMNCYKGAMGAVLRLRGYKVLALSATDPNPVFANSDNSSLRNGNNRATYKETMTNYAGAYEFIMGIPEEEKAALRLMAHGDADKGIAPYPDGTVVISWNGHARVNMLYKGKWFRSDPYGFDGVHASATRPGNRYATYIRPISEDKIVSAMHSLDFIENREECRRTIDALYRLRENTNNPHANFAATDNRRQTVLSFAMAAARLGIRGLSISGRRGGRRPTREEIIRCADYLSRSPDSPYIKYQSSVVIRPQDKLIPAAVGLTRKE